jgi:thioesterase domain-containing protein
MKMVVRLEQELRVKVPVRMAIEGRTVRRISSLLTGEANPAAPAAADQRRGGPDAHAGSTGTATGQPGIIMLRPGISQNLFLLHDGLGEILLYLNLALRLPASIAVYGVEPTSLPGVALAFNSIEEMAAAYAAQIRAIQPRGPYFLGGTCGGGTAAFAIANYLTRELGEKVQLVAIFDGPAPHATRRPGKRIANLKASIAAILAGKQSVLRKWREVAALVARKGVNSTLYNSGVAIRRVTVVLRLRLLRWLLARKAAWPRWLPPLSIQQIGWELEDHYFPPALPDVPVLLIRATRGTGDLADAPFHEYFPEAHFGWARLAPNLEVVDVSGGHTSMLQVEHVDAMVAVLAPKIHVRV